VKLSKVGPVVSTVEENSDPESKKDDTDMKRDRPRKRDVKASAKKRLVPSVRIVEQSISATPGQTSVAGEAAVVDSLDDNDEEFNPHEAEIMNEDELLTPQRMAYLA